MNKLVNTSIPEYHSFNQMLSKLKEELKEIFPLFDNKNFVYFEDERYYSWCMKIKEGIGVGLYKELTGVEEGRIIMDCDRGVILLFIGIFVFQYEMIENRLYIGIAKMEG
jgi:hypothetical protein